MKDEFLLADLKSGVYQEWVLLVKQNPPLITGLLQNWSILLKSSYWRTMLAR